MLHIKSQGHWPSGEEDFKGFLPYMGWKSSWSCTKVLTQHRERADLTEMLLT